MPANSDNRTELSVTGMTCGNCARHVTEAIQSVPGVQSATVSLDSEHATVRWTNGVTPDPPALIHAIEEEGYGAKPLAEVAHNHDHDGHRLAGWQLNLWIGVLGTAPLMIGEWIFHWGLTPWFQWCSFVLAGIVQVFAGGKFYRGAWNQLKVRSSNMDTLVALGSTTAFAYSAWALLSGAGGHLYFMEAAAIITLVSIGHWMESRVTARASSALRKLLNLAPPTARRLVGSSTASNKSGTASSFSPLDLRTFKPVAAPPTSEEEIPVAQLNIGDVVVLRPGDRVPTDSEVVEGDSAVDEAMLTGESAPADKKIGSELYAGTVNLNGRLLMRVTATGEATALAHIIAAVQRAQTSRANIQRIGDRVSSVFVPVVVAVAIAAALWWGLAPDSARQVHDWLAPLLWHAPPAATALAAAFITASAVLIIACPCAMGLATPAAIMAGSNAAAQRGILIRDGAALEKAGEVTAVIFDKTGTLTVGKPEVAAIAAPGPDPARFEALTISAGSESSVLLAVLGAALARRSTHPISRAIARLSGDEIPLNGWREIRGAGVEARVPKFNLGKSVHEGTARLGSLPWLRQSGVELSRADAFVSEWSRQGATLVGLEIEKSLLAVFAIKDTLKPGASKVIAQLQRQGLKTFLVTGDNALTAASIAKQAGIQLENVFAEVRPEQKADFVKKLQQQGERVAFVGDGINDAPALEQADLGIAVSRASDIAREAADIILLKSEIEAVPESLGLARATLRTIKQNLFWAFFYNAIGVPLAALGFMSPVLCAAAMGFSDLIVIGNALRLSRWRFARE
jgi:Cu+-exporting ATPase